MHQNQLIAVGYFATAGGDTVNHIAAWSGSDWSSLGSGLGGFFGTTGYTLQTFNSNLLVGGYFTTAGGKASSYFAEWTKQASACPIAMTGDVNNTGDRGTSDIIYLVNRVLKAGPALIPCQAAGDVNCDGSLSTSDIIYLVNFVLKGGPAPCDVCTIIPGTWSCP